MTWWLIFIMATGTNSGKEVIRFAMPGVGYESCREEALYQMQRNPKFNVTCRKVVN